MKTIKIMYNFIIFTFTYSLKMQ